MYILAWLLLVGFFIIILAWILVTIFWDERKGKK